MMHLKNSGFTFLLACAAISFSHGQTTHKLVGAQPTFTSKNARLIKTQGSSEHQNIHCSLQDRNGHLWFGTTGEGVYRYDGTTFTQYTQQDGLSDNRIYCILEDRSGNIWFGTHDGVSRYDGKTITKVPFTHHLAGGLNVPVPPSDRREVWSMLQDKTGRIWFGSSQALYCYDGKSFSRFLDNRQLVNNQQLKLTWIQTMLEDSDGTIWFGSGPLAQEGVIHFDGKAVTSSKPNGDGWIRHIRKVNSGVLWFSGRQHGVFRYDGHRFEPFTDNIIKGSAMLVDKAGHIWFDGGEKKSSIESNNGIWRYNGKIFENFNYLQGMGKNSAWSFLQDAAGNIWIGTRNCELFRYDGKTFTCFSK